MTLDYKETLNLPETDFPMKANLAQMEPRILDEWCSKNLYAVIREKRKDSTKYILHDGPPYANGNIHQGHALNKVLKDLVIKIKTMEGFNAPYVPGWDCHGLPIEHQVDKKLGSKKNKMTKNEIRKECREYAQKFVDIQREEFKRLGILGEWDNPYLTMSYTYEAQIVRELGSFFEKGAIYRGLKPIHWCPNCRTALAEAEVEHDTHSSPSIYVKFSLKSTGKERFSFIERKETYLVIWTTTPWTLPANLAVAANPNYRYAFAETEDSILVIAADLLSSAMEKFGYEKYTVIEEVSGKDLEGLIYKHPFEDRESPVILGDHVTLEAGTGLVHTAPGHGQDDYVAGLKYGLEVYNPVDDSGNFISTLKHFGGMNVWVANKEINNLLKNEGFLLKEEIISHQYPHCWRCKKPIIFRGTSQWFVSMEKNNLRKEALKEIKNVTWVPAWGEERIYQMVENRPDWCISRQRAWGVPITAFYCKKCDEILASKEICLHVADLIEKEGADIWFSMDESKLIKTGTACHKCGGTEFKKEMDILDVWFDSGVSFAAVVEQNADLSFPSDLYLEGSDQHRGWFHSSLLASVVTRGKAPYKSVLTHGYVVDGAGKKMAKSVGNVISPQEIISKFGAEVLRLWVSSENYREDIRLSDEILKRLADAYRKIRNTFRYMLGNLKDFNPAKDRVEYKDLKEIDKLILHRLQRLSEEIRNAFDKHEYHVFFHSFHNFCTNDLSSFYLDIIKDRLYTMKHDSLNRRSAQTAIYELADTMVRLMAPVLSFTAEEIWRYIPGINKDESVHAELFNKINHDWICDDLFAKWEKIVLIRKEVSKALEKARKDKIIGHSLDAGIVLYVPPDFGLDIASYEMELKDIFIISKAVLSRDARPCVSMEDAKSCVSTDTYISEEIKGLWVKISSASGKKCERCWNYNDTVGNVSAHPAICSRCAENL